MVTTDEPKPKTSPFVEPAKGTAKVEPETYDVHDPIEARIDRA